MGTYIGVDELRAHLGADPVDVPDAVLSDYIDALEEEIDTRFGTLLPTTVRLSGGWDRLVLGRRARSIVSIVELDDDAGGTTTLDPADFAVRSPYLVERLSTGPNPATAWSTYGVDVTFLPLDDSARRKLAIASVAKLESGTIGLAGVGGTTIRIGDYSEGSGGGGGSSIDATKLEKDRESILRRLRHRKLVIA